MKLPIPAKRGTIVLIKIKSCNSFFICCWYQHPHKSVFWRRILISVTSHSDNPYWRERKDVMIRGYFSKPKGVREQIFWETLNKALRKESLSLGTRFCELLLCFRLWEMCVLLCIFDCCGSEYNNVHYTVVSSCCWYIDKRMSRFQPLASDALPTLFRHSIL